MIKHNTPDAYREGDGLYRSRTATETYPTGDYGTGTPAAAPVLDPLPPAPAYPPTVSRPSTQALPDEYPLSTRRARHRR